LRIRIFSFSFSLLRSKAAIFSTIRLRVGLIGGPAVSSWSYSCSSWSKAEFTSFDGPAPSWRVTVAAALTYWWNKVQSEWQNGWTTRSGAIHVLCWSPTAFLRALYTLTWGNLCYGDTFSLTKKDGFISYVLLHRKNKFCSLIIWILIIGHMSLKALIAILDPWFCCYCQHSDKYHASVREYCEQNVNE
jgi:hypothetical protein